MNSDHSRGAKGALDGTLLRKLAPLLMLLPLGGWLTICRPPRVFAQAEQAKLFLAHEKRVDTRYPGGLSRQAAPLSLASVDFDVDGIQDLAVGMATPAGGAIAIHRGNLDAFAPQSDASFWAITRGEFPSPFLPDAQLVQIPNRPDFLAAGDFIGLNGPGVVAAARGGSGLYVLARGASKSVELLQSIDVDGAIAALAAHKLENGKYDGLLVGAHTAKGSQLLVYRGSPSGLSQVAAYSLSADAASFAFGDLDGDGLPDALILADGKVWILHGGSHTIDPVQVPYRVAAADTGRFVFDRDPLPQIALLASDGSLHVLAHGLPDQRPYTADEIRARRLANLHTRRAPQAQRTVAWQEIESYSQAGASDSSGHAPLMFRTRISSNGADDVMVLNAARMSVVVHSDRNPANGLVLGRSDLAADAVAALPVRVNVDGRPGVVFLARGDTMPHVMMPLPDPTFVVNTTSDTVDADPGDGVCADSSGHCSLRAAIMEANAYPGTDTISIPAGTYTLTIARSASPAYDARTGTLDVTDSVNIVGSGQNSTIIQGGTQGASGTPNGVDKVFSFNQDITAFTDATVAVSNLTIRNGYNRGNTTIQDGWGGAFDFDTGGFGNSNLTLNNVTLNDNTLTDGEGGGFATFNTNDGLGTATFDGCVVENNVSTPGVGGDAGNGGAAFVAFPSAVVLNSSQVAGNQAKAGDGSYPVGGAFEVYGTLDLHNTTVSGNTAAGPGGAIWFGSGGSIGGLTFDNATALLNNTSSDVGGAVYFAGASGNSATLSTLTITGNSATDGGGIYISPGNQAPFSMHYSRIAGNIATSSLGSNFSQVSPTTGSPGAITITDDWWGTNAPLSRFTLGNGNTTTYDPFIFLAYTASPQKIRINQATTLSADMSKDNNGSGAALSDNLGVIAGLDVTFDNPALGSIPQTQPELLNAVAQATATFNAGGTAGVGTANATVDQAVVDVNSNAIAKATEAGTTATITTVGAHGFSPGDTVVISGVGLAGYDTPGGQRATILSTPSATTFTYTASSSGLTSSSGGTASGGIVILEPPSITKSFNPTTVQPGTASTVTFSIANGNVVPVDASFSDTLPADVGSTPGSLVVASPPNVVNNCGGSVTATAGAGSISFSNASLAVGTCTIQVNVQSPVDNSYTNSVTIDSTDAGDGNASSATVTVIAPPHIVKVFGASTIPLNGTTTLTFTVSSANANLILSGIAFADSLPSGLVVATPSNLSSTCSGTQIGNAGSSSVSLSGASLSPGTPSCTVSLSVQGTTAGVKSNSVTVSSGNAGIGNTSIAAITVVSPPTIAKSFGASSIPLGGSATLSFTLQNNNGTTTLTGIAFTDTLPSGLTVSSSSYGLSGSCGGTISTTVSGSSVGLSGLTVAANSSCTFSVNVTGIAAGTQNNVTGAVTSTEGGTGLTASASIDVEAPPSIAKSFNPGSIAPNATTNLTFTITNPAGNPDALTAVGFSDTLPTGLTVSSAIAPVCGGTLTVTAPVTISLAGATVATGTPCTFSLTVTGASGGGYTNTTGNVTSSNGGTGNAASANLTVTSSPSISKGFSPASISLGGTSTLTLTIINPNSGVALSGVAFTDNLPSGMTVAATPGTSNSCGGSVTATGGGSSVSLASGAISAGGSCAVSVTVQGNTAGTLNNSVQVTSSNAGTGNTSSASLTVEAPPSIAKSFNPSSIALNGSTTLTFTIANPAGNPAALTGVGFTDTLPTGLTVTSGTSSVCGGTLTVTAPVTIQLSGAAVATGTPCIFSVTVTGGTAGGYTNITGSVTSTNGGTGNPASASVTVVAPPSISKAFGTGSISLNGSTTLTFTIANPPANTVAETGVAFGDNLPTGLVVSSTPALTNSCNGTPAAAAGASSVSLTGGSIPVNSQCQVSVSVTGTTGGVKNNTTGNVSSTNGGTGSTASASLTVTAPTTVTNVSSTAANGPHGTGAVIPITVTFSAAVTVTGTPQISLNSGGTAMYTSGSGTSTLTFTYTVAAGNGSADLDASSSSALTLNGGMIVDSSAANAILTLPIGAAIGSLPSSKSISIDTVAPTVVSYSVLWGAQSYNVIGTARNRLPWQIAGIQVVFSKPITAGNLNSLSGIPTLALAGLGTTTLSWTITPQSIGLFTTQLAGSGANALMDVAGNPLAGGTGFSQNLKILWGDFNDDGYVNATDLLQVYDAISQPYNIFADMNGDGVVNAADVLVVRSRAGTTLP
jgi:CSLREA domain-containing protein/uncharacterized repeat protein (TIGR01451 family)